VRDADHHSVLANLMRENIGSDNGFWINLNDIDREGTYVWQTSQEVLDDFAAWGTNQPDGIAQENCVAASKEHYFFW